MTITARTIIKKAMNKIGALVKNEDPAADEANDALDSLNALISSISNDALNIYARTWETFNLVGGTGSYTIGSSGVFNTTRPIQILDCYVNLDSISYGMSVITDEAYDSIAYKNLQGIPEFLNYDNAYPLGKIRLYPIPNSNYPLFLLSEKAVSRFATLDTVLSLPDGWERFLIYNLAVELAPEYQQQPDPSVIKIAAESMGIIKLAVARVRTMDAFPQDIVVRNIYSGWRY